MKVIELTVLPGTQQKTWISRMKTQDDYLPRSLADKLERGTFLQRSKGEGKVFLLTDGKRLVSMMTLVRQDDVESEDGPWLGYVYTSPEYRGKRLSFQLMDDIVSMLEERGIPEVFVSSSHRNLYEKAGFDPVYETVTIHGDRTTVFKRRLDSQSETGKDYERKEKNPFQ